MFKNRRTRRRTRQLDVEMLEKREVFSISGPTLTGDLPLMDAGGQAASLVPAEITSVGGSQVVEVSQQSGTAALRQLSGAEHAAMSPLAVDAIFADRCNDALSASGSLPRHVDEDALSAEMSNDNAAGGRQNPLGQLVPHPVLESEVDFRSKETVRQAEADNLLRERSKLFIHLAAYQRGQTVVERFIQPLDENGDGTVTLTDAEGTALAVRLLTRVDEDGDGRVTLEQVAQHYQKRGLASRAASLEKHGLPVETIDETTYRELRRRYELINQVLQERRVGQDLPRFDDFRTRTPSGLLGVKG